MKGAITEMENTPFDPIDIASLHVWRRSENGDNSPRLERLSHNLPLALKQELTPCQRRMVEMRYFQNMRVTDIAAELGISKSSVSRTLRRAQDRLYRSLRYSL